MNLWLWKLLVSTTKELLADLMVMLLVDSRLSMQPPHPAWFTESPAHRLITDLNPILSFVELKIHSTTADTLKYTFKRFFVLLFCIYQAYINHHEKGS
jgi:hypothetical protein